jgi:elongation factor G
MKILSAPDLRNIAVVGHNTVGKTTLVATLLYAAGATTRPGRIDDGTCPTDFDTEEIERKISINLAVAHAMHRDARINFLDAPGYGIFAPEARAAVAAADSALIVCDAVSGVEVQTEDVEVREGIRPARAVRREPHGPRAGLLRPGDGVSPEEVRPRSGRSPDPDR